MRALVFSKRTFKEIIREPLSLVFCFAFPLVLLTIFQIIFASLPAEAVIETPQFRIDSLACSITVFGFSFLTLFTGMSISKDRTSSFQARLNSSPMRATDFLLGYTLPLFPIAFMQTTLTLLICVIFGLPITVNLLLVYVALIPACLLFVSLGVLIGASFSPNAGNGMSSIIINICVFLSGMFFPLETMTGAFVTITNILPFAPALQLVKGALNGNLTELLVPFLTVMAYVVVIFAIAIFVFYRKMKVDKR